MQCLTLSEDVPVVSGNIYEFAWGVPQITRFDSPEMRDLKEHLGEEVLFRFDGDIAAVFDGDARIVAHVIGAEVRFTRAGRPYLLLRGEIDDVMHLVLKAGYRVAACGEFAPDGNRRGDERIGPSVLNPLRKDYVSRRIMYPKDVLVYTTREHIVCFDGNAYELFHHCNKYEMADLSAPNELATYHTKYRNAESFFVACIMNGHSIRIISRTSTSDGEVLTELRSIHPMKTRGHA